MRTAAIACCWLGLASQGLASDLTFQIRDGRVTLDARDVSVREILAEWAPAPIQCMPVRLRRVPIATAVEDLLVAEVGSMPRRAQTGAPSRVKRSSICRPEPSSAQREGP